MNQELSTDQIQSILQGVSIPPQPQIMVDLQMEQVSPNCSMEKISELICQDVGLSGSILKTVNSDFFGHTNRITSINQAVNLLGVKSVVNLVNALSIRGELSDHDIINLGRFWDSAMEVAMASTLIAKRIGFPHVDEAYTLGLFHNCAIPLCMARFSNYIAVEEQAYGSQDESITEVENRLIKTNHGVVGYYVGRSWRLPEYLCQAIHEHHRVEGILGEARNDPRKTTLLAILKIAEHACALYSILGNQDENYEWQRVEAEVLEYTGLSQPDFLSLLGSIEEIGLGARDYYRC